MRQLNTAIGLRLSEEELAKLDALVKRRRKATGEAWDRSAVLRDLIREATKGKRR
jgi:hypothetical protein